MAGHEQTARRLRFVCIILSVLFVAFLGVILVSLNTPMTLYSNCPNLGPVKVPIFGINRSSMTTLRYSGRLTLDFEVTKTEPDEVLPTPPTPGKFFEIVLYDELLAFVTHEISVSALPNGYRFTRQQSSVSANLIPWLIALLAGLVVFWTWYWFARRKLRAGLCTVCGYNLTGLVSDRCPECGTAVSITDAKAESPGPQ